MSLRPHRVLVGALVVAAFVAPGCGDKEVEALDSGNTTETTETTETTTDTTTDPTTDTTNPTTTPTGTTTGTPTTDTETPTSANLLVNPGFEAGWSDWLIYPVDLLNFAVLTTGDPLFNSADLFTAYEGSQSVKVWGQYTGGPNETPIYQEFPAVAGQTYTFSGSAWIHHDDPLTKGDTYGHLSIKYFDDFYNFLGSTDSGLMTNLSAVDTWTPLSATGVVPPGATKVQAALEYWQCVGDVTGVCFDGNGSLYFDDLSFTLDGATTPTTPTTPTDTGTAPTTPTDTGTAPTTPTDTGTAPTTPTDTGTPTGTPTDTGTPVLGLELANGSFESGWDGSWLIYPVTLSNFAISVTGEGIFGSATGATFTALDGTQALKVYGQFTGWQNETPIYQEFPAAAGEWHSLSGYAFMAGEDQITGATTYAQLQLKYFDEFYNYYGSSDSITVGAGSATDTWIPLEASGYVPAGATKVQAAVEYWHCVGSAYGACYDGGSVYFDALVLE